MSPSYGSPEEISITGTEIDLGQFLKLSRAVQSGGEGKALIQQGAVRVNGEVETRRGRTLRQGDVVRLAGRGMYLVAVQSADTQRELT